MTPELLQAAKSVKMRSLNLAEQLLKVKNESDKL